MTFARASGTLGIVALAAASPIAVAADSGGYVGISVGPSRSHFDELKMTQQLAPGFATTSIAEDDSDIGFKAFGGYQFNRYFAVEGGYFELGKFGFTSTTIPAGTLTNTMKVKGLNLDAVGILPITEKWSALARIGIQHARTKDVFTGTGAVVVASPSAKESDTNYKFGVGVQYDFSESLGMRAEAERYRISDGIGGKGKIDLFSLGLIYRFGGKAPPPPPVYRPAAVTSPPREAAPPPQPVAPPPPREVIAPPPPPVQEVVTPPPPPPARQQAPARRDRN